jgi:hypothetical protein
MAYKTLTETHISSKYNAVLPKRLRMSETLNQTQALQDGLVELFQNITGLKTAISGKQM